MPSGCMPIAKFLACRTPGTEPPFQKYQEPFSRAVPGLCVCVCVTLCVRTAAHILQSHLLCEFSPKTFPHMSANFHKISAPFTGAVETIFSKISEYFGQNIHNFSKRSLQCMGVVVVCS